MAPLGDRRCGLVLALLCVGACAQPGGPREQAYLLEKGPYQAVYAPDGRMLRLLQDKDGDGRAEVVVAYEPDGTRRAELDGDSDGIVERWEVYDSANRLVRVGQSRRTPGRADLWERLDAKGAVRERELDEDGDGRIDRRERFETQGLAGVELDTDGDGRIDHWQKWQAARLVSEELDTDGDGNPDRRLLYDARGTLQLVKLRP